MKRLNKKKFSRKLVWGAVSALTGDSETLARSVDKTNSRIPVPKQSWPPAYPTRQYIVVVSPIPTSAHRHCLEFDLAYLLP